VRFVCDEAGVIWRALFDLSEAGDCAMRSEVPQTTVEARELPVTEGAGVGSGVVAMLWTGWGFLLFRFDVVDSGEV